MKEVWTLSIKTSLPEACRDRNTDMKEITMYFDDFNVACDSFREALKKYAYSDNAMFDGKGYLKTFNRYIEEAEVIEEELREDGTVFADNDGYITCSILRQIHEDIRHILLGDNSELSYPCQKYTDCYLSIDIKPNTVALKGFDDGPINGIDPVIRTNAFNMTKRKNYFFYVDDMFGGLWDQECSAELYLDLKHTKME